MRNINILLCQEKYMHLLFQAVHRAEPDHPAALRLILPVVFRPFMHPVPIRETSYDKEALSERLLVAGVEI